MGAHAACHRGQGRGQGQAWLQRWDLLSIPRHLPNPLSRNLPQGPLYYSGDVAGGAAGSTEAGWETEPITPTLQRVIGDHPTAPWLLPPERGRGRRSSPSFFSQLLRASL